MKRRVIAVGVKLVGTNNVNVHDYLSGTCVITIDTVICVQQLSFFTRDSIYAIARICHRNSVCLSVCHTGRSVKSV